MILYGNPVVEVLKKKLKYEFSKLDWENKYIAILLLQNHLPSKVYVNKKKQFGEEVGLKVKIFNYLELETIESIYKKIDSLNKDENCVGIVVQLPLPKYLINFQSKILSKISPQKDIDGLGGVLFGLSQIGLFDFTPATPKATLKILEYYNLDDLKGKKVSVLGQSNLVGKPLVFELIKRGAEVYSFNHYLKEEEIKKIVKQSDLIFSATGVVHLIGKDWVERNQIIIDIGWGYKNGKPVGDVNFEEVKNVVKAITPVPGGVGPVTVASLFDNILSLRTIIREINMICKF